MAIVVENLSYTYMKGTPFQKEALKGVNLRINDGEFVGIIGHTGSGKTTLIQHFNGLLKPDSGKVTVNGIDVSSSNLKELRKRVGMVFQYPEHQLFEETVYKDIAFGLRKQGLDEKTIEERINEAIASVGLPQDILGKSPFELSGGQKRRTAMAGVLVMNPKILIMDEPAAGLDPAGREDIFSLISRLHREKNITIILVSHSMEDIARLSQRIIVLNEGRIDMDGTPREIFMNTEQLEKMGLSAPTITYFMKALKKVVPEINDEIFLLEEAKNEIAAYLKKRGRVPR